MERVLTSSDEMKKVVTGRREMEHTKLFCMHKLAHWDNLFPIDFKSVLHCLRDIVKELVDFLRLPSVQAIEVDYPFNTQGGEGMDELLP